MTNTYRKGNSLNEVRTTIKLGFFDVVVDSQDSYNAIVERVSANNYKFSDNLKSILILGVAIDFRNALSGGDTWGALKTNNCVNLQFMNGAYIDMFDSDSWLEVNTSNAKINDVELRSSTTTNQDITRLFLLAGENVTFSNCSASFVRTSGAVNAIVIFDGGSNIAMQNTSRFTNCIVRNSTLENKSGWTGTVAAMFKSCKNLTGCSVREVNIAANTVAIVRSAFLDCENLVNCITDRFYEGVGTTNTERTFNNCIRLSNCLVYNNTVGVGNNTNPAGYYQCTDLVCCTVDLWGDTGDQNISTFFECVRLSCCYSSRIQSTHSGTQAFKNCSYISSCGSDGSEAPYAGNTGNDYVDTDDTNVTNKHSTPVTGDGFWT